MGGAAINNSLAENQQFGFNAARGFVGGAAFLWYQDDIRCIVSMPHAAIPFRPHHRFAVPLPRSRRGGLVTLCFFAGSCNISFPRRCGGSGERSEPIGALMPHAAILFRPHHRFAVPLPRSRRGGLVTLCFFAGSCNISFPRRCGGAINVCQSHFVLLVFLGRFPIRPVSRSAVPYGLASRTGQ